MSIKVIVADDHQIIREGLVGIIKNDDSFEIIAETGDGLQAFNKIKELKPDVAVLDISMPHMTGLKIAQETQKENLGVNFIILTMHNDQEYFKEAIKAGVKGYILKENSSHDLITALKFVSRGKSYISPLLSESLLKTHEEGESFKNLSPAEKRVLKLISENKTSREIADELCISYRTVQNHRSNICTKLNIHGMNALLKFAIHNKSDL